MSIKQVLDVLLSYVPEKYRRYVPLAGMVAIILLAVFGSRYLTVEQQAEIKSAIQTAIVAPTPTP